MQHVGFDPPPLKIVERRLQGEVTDVPARADTAAAFTDPADAGLAAVRAALADFPRGQPMGAMTTAQAEQLRAAEPALNAAATRRPEIFLDGLRALRRRLAAEPGRAADDFRTCESALLHLLPPAEALPASPADPAPSLSDAYFHALTALPVSAAHP